MKNKLSLFYFLIISILLFANLPVKSQTFQKNILVDIPGENYDLNVLSPSYFGLGEPTFISWINKNNLTYTVYLKQISPETGENVIVDSGQNIKSNPCVALNRYSEGIKIAWQNLIDNRWLIAYRNYNSDTLSEIIILNDSLQSDPQISLNTHRVAWIENENLYVKEFYPELSNPILVDTSGCSFPDLIKSDDTGNTIILYQKEETSNKEIYVAELIEYPQSHWEKKIISGSNDNINPNFGFDRGVAFQTYVDQVWKIKYTPYLDAEFILTTNQNCNYKNPFVFTYPVPTGIREEKTPFFVAFDTDSLENNNEIIIRTFYFDPDYYANLINISNMEGNDYEPSVAYVSNEDTVYVAILWMHSDNEKKHIWISKTIFNPIYSDVKETESNLNSYYLSQNYPNPFNPNTHIEYFLPEEGNVELKVYDIIGNEIAILVNQHQQPGKYKVNFGANNLSAGVYIVKLNSGKFVKSFKMVLIK